MEKTELTVSMEPERLDALRYFLAAKNKRTPQKELQRALEELYEAYVPAETRPIWTPGAGRTGTGAGGRRHPRPHRYRRRKRYMETIELSGRTGQEVYEELKHRLEGMGYLPDEYFLLDADWEDRRVIPRNADLFCTTDYGDSEGIYLDVYLKWYGEDGKPVIKTFATGKTLGESGSDMDRMFLISSAITKHFTVSTALMPDSRVRRTAQKRKRGAPSQPEGTAGAHGRAAGTADAAGGADDGYRTASCAAWRAASPPTWTRWRPPPAHEHSGPGPAGRPGWGALCLFLPGSPDHEAGGAGQPAGRSAGRPGQWADGWPTDAWDKSPYPEDVWLDACKRAVDTGDLQRVQTMLDRTMDKVTDPFPALPGEVLRYAYLQNPAMARDLIRWAPPEQVAAAPIGLLYDAARACDLHALTNLTRKGLQPQGSAAPALRPLIARGSEWMAVELLRSVLQVRQDDYEALDACLRKHASSAAEALLENGVELDGYLAWAAKQNVLLDTQAQEILDRLAEQQAQVNSAPEQNGPVLGGMSL